MLISFYLVSVLPDGKLEWRWLLATDHIADITHLEELLREAAVHAYHLKHKSETEFTITIQRHYKEKRYKRTAIGYAKVTLNPANLTVEVKALNLPGPEHRHIVDEYKMLKGRNPAEEIPPTVPQKNFNPLTAQPQYEYHPSYEPVRVYGYFPAEEQVEDLKVYGHPAEASYLPLKIRTAVEAKEEW